MGDIIEEIKVPVQQRPKFYYNNNTVTIPRYFYRFIGVHANVDDYTRWLATLDSSLSNFNNFYLKLVNGLEYTIETDTINRLEVAWQRIKLLADFKPQDVVKNIDNLGLFPSCASKILNKQIRENFEALIEYYFEVNNDQLDEIEFKNIIYYTVFWVKLYFEKLFDDFDYVDINPKILFYGEIKTFEIFFLLYMSSFGCDIIYLNPLEDGPFDLVDPKGIFSYKHELVRRVKNVEFPSYVKSARIETTAKQAEEQVQSALRSDDSGFFKPWQLADYALDVKTLATSYSEIPVWLKTEALYRTGWNVSNNTVTLTNIFAKISGVPKNIKTYLKEIQEQVELDKVKFFTKSPFATRRTDEIQKFNQIIHYRGSKAYLNKDDLINAAWWPYGKLRGSLQNLLAEKITYIINENIITNKSLPDSDEVLIQVFSKLLHIDDWLIELLMNFDYPFAVPKVIVYNNVNLAGQSLTFFDSIMLLLANTLGMDVLIYTPSGYQDIENYIDPNLHLYDIHRLEAVDLKLEFKFSTMHYLKKLF